MGIRVEQIEQAMMKVVAQIPLDEQIVQAAANHGVPFILRDQSQPVSQGILQLAQHIRDTVLLEQEEESLELGADASRLRLGRVFG